MIELTPEMERQLAERAIDLVRAAVSDQICGTLRCEHREEKIAVLSELMSVCNEEIVFILKEIIDDLMRMP